MRNRDIRNLRGITQQGIHRVHGAFQLADELVLVAVSSLGKVILEGLNLPVKLRHTLGQALAVSLQVFRGILTQGVRGVVQAGAQFVHLRAGAGNRRIDIVHQVDSALKHRNLVGVVLIEAVVEHALTRKIRGEPRLNRDIEIGCLEVLRIHLQRERCARPGGRRRQDRAPLHVRFAVPGRADHAVGCAVVRLIAGGNDLVGFHVIERNRSCHRKRNTDERLVGALGAARIVAYLLGLERKVFDGDLNSQLAGVPVQVFQVCTGAFGALVLGADAHRDVVNNVLDLEVDGLAGALVLLFIDIDIVGVNSRNVTVARKFKIHVLQHVRGVLHLLFALLGRLPGRGRITILLV